MKVYGALEVAQLEWFTNAGKPAASSYQYRVIYVSDLKQVQVSDGTNWIPFLNTATNQTVTGDITFNGQQIFNGLHRLSVTTDSSSTGAIVALNNVTPVIEFTGAVTSIAGISNVASGATVMLVNRTGSSISVLDEGAGASAAARIKTGTGAQITLANNASILLTYVGDSRWHVIGGSGSGTGGGALNYITNGSAEADTLGWATYADAAGTSPVDGTGGVANVTFTRSTTSPLVGTASFIFTKDAVNRQGQGASYAFTIDAGYKAKVLQISFQYLVDSGTFAAGTSSTDSDVTVWLYDVTNGLVIQPSSYKLLSNNGSIADTFNGTFQTASNSTSYRLIFHVGSTSASAFALKIDNISVSPSTYVYGTPITDWTSYTPTGGFTTNTTYIGKWRRVGDSMEISARVSFSGSPGGTAASVNLPFGSIDTSKIDMSTGYFACGESLANIGSNYYVGTAVVSSSFTNAITFFGASSTTTSWTNISPASWVSGSYYTFTAKVPIQGWSSSVQTSDQTDTRVVAFFATNTGSSTTAIPTGSTGTKIVNLTSQIDTHGAWNNTTQAYTIPVSGIYDITTAIYIGSIASPINVGVFLDGVYNEFSSQLGTNVTVSSNRARYLNAGTTVSLGTYQTTGSTQNYGSFNPTLLKIQRLSGPSAIAATETVACSYTSGGTQVNIPNAAITTCTVFTNKIYDTHGAFSAGGTFTAPISGTYHVDASLQYAINGTGIRVLYASSSTETYILGDLQSNSSNYTQPQGSCLMKLSAGQTMQIKTYQSSGGLLANYIDAAGCFVNIVRVGN